MADNETSYLPIGTCLEQIEQAVYGREVRKAIHDGIAQCYDDTVEGVNAAQQAASDTQEVINNAVTATNLANQATLAASNVKVEQTVSGDTVTFTTTKRDGSTVSTSFQKPNVVVSKDEGSGEFSVTATGWNGEEIIATIPDPSEEVKSRATIAAVSKVKTALGNPLTITDGMDAPAVKTVVTLEPKQDLHGYDHPWVGGAGKNLLESTAVTKVHNNVTFTVNSDGSITATGTATGGNAYISINTDGHILADACLLSGCSGGSSSTYRLRVSDASGSSTVYYNNYNESTELPAGTTLTQVMVYVTEGASVNRVVFKPMIRKATETDPTYEPYSNICPIEGYDTVRVTATGKNLWDGVILNGCYTDANFTVGGSSPNIQKSLRTHLLAGTYTISFIPKTAGTTYRIVRRVYPDVKDGFSASGIENLTSYTFTLSKECDVGFSFRREDNAVWGYSDVQIVRGSSATEYTPTGNTTSLSVAQAAGATVYGGTVTLNEDGSGTLVVDKQYLKGSECTWSLNASNANTFNGQHTYALSVANDTTGYSSAYVMYTSNQVANHDYGFAHANAGRMLYVKDKDYSDLASFQTHIADVEFVYNLATPSNPINLTASQLRTLTGENHVWTDGTKLELTYRADKYADVEKFLNAIPTGTKTGDPAVFTDGADDLPFEKLTIAVEPHQEGSGDPSPDNIRPITGWDEVNVTRCGKNLCPGSVKSETAFGLTTAVQSDGTFVVTGTYERNQATTYYDVTKAVTLQAGTYTLSGTPSNTYGIALRIRTATNVNLVTGNTHFTLAEPTEIQVAMYAPASMNGTALPAAGLTFSPMVSAGAESSPTYEPYTASATLPISLKYATGSTVYGGTVTINRDGTGSVVVDRAYIEMSGFQYESGATRFWYANVPTPYGATVSRTGSFVCDKYKAVTDGRAISGVSTGMCYFGAQKSNGHCDFYVHDTRYTDAATFNATVGAVAIAYKLATPTTYTLTAPQLTSLLGNNTVWCDAGQVTVKYKRDIGKALSAIEAVLISNGLMVDVEIAEPAA